MPAFSLTVLINLYGRRMTYTILTVHSPVRIPCYRHAVYAPGQYRIEGDISTKFRKTADMRLITSGAIQLEVVEEIPDDQIIPSLERGLVLILDPDEPVLEFGDLPADYKAKQSAPDYNKLFETISAAIAEGMPGNAVVEDEPVVVHFDSATDELELEHDQDSPSSAEGSAEDQQPAEERGTVQGSP